jgi:hypothetical protein
LKRKPKFVPNADPSARVSPRIIEVLALDTLDGQSRVVSVVSNAREHFLLGR